jgi:vacuolar-type H+-ATPase subunit H
MSNYENLPPSERPGSSIYLVPIQHSKALDVAFNSLIMALARSHVLPIAVIRDVLRHAASRAGGDQAQRVIQLWIADFEFHVASLGEPAAAETGAAPAELSQAQVAATRIVERAHQHAASVMAEAQYSASRLAVTPMTQTELDWIKSDVRGRAETTANQMIAEAQTKAKAIIAEAEQTLAQAKPGKSPKAAA